MNRLILVALSLVFFGLTLGSAPTAMAWDRWHPYRHYPRVIYGRPYFVPPPVVVAPPYYYPPAPGVTVYLR